MKVKFILFLIFFVVLILTLLLLLKSTDIDISQTVAYKVPETKEIQTEKDSLSLLFVGDIMLGRHVETLMSRHGNEYPFLYWPEIKNDNYDFIIGNLEGPISQNHIKTADFTTSFSFKSDVAKVLAKNGFTHLSLANNHTFDKGEVNYLNTQNVLVEAGIKWFGHPQKTGIEYLAIENKNGVEFVLIGINEAVSKFFDFDQSLAFISEVRELYPKAMIIPYIHWGTEYERKSNLIQQDWARKAIDLGAEIVIGHHPHVTQEVEVYKEKYILYSLGNFIFDQYFSRDTQESLAVKIELAKDGVKKLELIPLESSKSQIRLMNEKRKNEFLKETYEKES